MVIHIYGITLNAAKSADQYSSSYSYQSLSLISYLVYNDLHHDCKPYEQTREFFTVSLLSGVTDYFDRNKISSGGDLSHYSSASLY